MVFCVDNLRVGGTELNAVRTAERLDKSRYELSVVCLQNGGPLGERYAAAGVSVMAFPLRNLYGRQTCREGARLVRYLRELQVDVVHSHDMYSNVFAVPCARYAGTPAVIASSRWSRDLMPVRYRVANDAATRLAHGVLTNSTTGANELRTRAKLRADRVTVIPNFVDESAFEPIAADVRKSMLARLGVPLGARVIGIVANLTPVKDHATLLRSLATIKIRWTDLHLILVGKGECRTSLEVLARELGIQDRVHFAGGQSNQPNLHHLFDVSVLCSRTEGLSNSILEAMAAGKPVVATDVGSTSELVVHGRSGILVPPADPVRLGAALDAVLSDPERGRRMGQDGQQRARTRYSPDVAIGALDRYYHSLLTNSQPV